jgi:hypothetical protein
LDRFGRRFRHWIKVVRIPRMEWHMDNDDPFKDTLFQEIVSSVIGERAGFNRIFTHSNKRKKREI